MSAQTVVAWGLLPGLLLSFVPILLTAILNGKLSREAEIRAAQHTHMVRMIALVLVVASGVIAASAHPGPAVEKGAFLMATPMFFFGRHQFFWGILFTAYLILMPLFM